MDIYGLYVSRVVYIKTTTVDTYNKSNSGQNKTENEYKSILNNKRNVYSVYIYSNSFIVINVVKYVRIIVIITLLLCEFFFMEITTIAHEA